MTDINCHREMDSFHASEVTLSGAQQGEMRERRDNGRVRLGTGLGVADLPLPKETHTQGSYAMRTMVQQASCDYDIDDGVYFRSEDLLDAASNPLSSLAARQRLCDALKRDKRLASEAEVKTNCVRQAYPQGYHIDVAVYRIVVTEEDGVKKVHYEHASGNAWKVSDARAVTRWFEGKVGGQLKAGEVDYSQRRRVTKLTKFFARSRVDWKKFDPSGITISKLVMDHFVEQADRDDLALRKTWKAIDETLKKSTQVVHPVRNENLAENGDVNVCHFRDRLSEALQTLEGLDAASCDRRAARKLWDDVFAVSYFLDQPDPDEPKKAAVAPMIVTSDKAARRDDGGGRYG